MTSTGLIYRDIENPDVSALGDFSKTVRFARIIDVYDAKVLETQSGESDKYGKVSIVFLDGVSSTPVLVPFLTSWFSWTRGSGITFMPEQNDIVACLQQNNGYPVIIGFLPYKWNNTLNKVERVISDPFGETKPLLKGEVSIKSSYGGSVVLDRNGTIVVDGSDSSISERVVSNIDAYNNEYSFDRVLPNKESGVSRAVFGKSYFLDGTVKNIGNFPQIYECGASETENSSMFLPFMSDVEFTLPSDTEITSINGLYVVYKEGDVKRKLELKPSQYKLSFSNIYPICSSDEQNIDFKPARVDRNTIGYTLHIVNVNVKGEALILDYTSRRFIGGIRVNLAGDVFIDGRNVVIRSENERAHMLLNKIGEANISGASSTTVGTKGLGYIKCTQNSVEYSKGIAGDNRDIDNISLENTLSGKFYCYISDTMPLLRVELKDGKWNFNGVTLNEYKSLKASEKASIIKFWFSLSDDLLTDKKIIGIMEEELPSYGELKRQD